MARIVVLSDIHLSPTHGFFWENWCVAREFADAAKADAVIVNGDLAINGPDSDAEIAFAATALGNLRTPVMALPAVTMKEGKTMTARRLLRRIIQHQILRSGVCRLFLLGCGVRSVLHTRSLDAKLDRLAQARGNEIGFRVIP
jgi:3',5'-cyclic AMP phosphodiesterase CpdA